MLLASNISRKSPSDSWAGVNTQWMQFSRICLAWFGSWTRDGSFGLHYLEKGSIRLVGRGAHTVDAAQPYMPILGLEAGLERALLAPSSLTKGQSDWWAGAHTSWMQQSLICLFLVWKLG
jgi:hypothetical protein